MDEAEEAAKDSEAEEQYQSPRSALSTKNKSGLVEGCGTLGQLRSAASDVRTKNRGSEMGPSQCSFLFSRGAIA
ncbi:hypothetical protein HN51_015361 [Arachis hypogaea]